MTKFKNEIDSEIEIDFDNEYLESISHESIQNEYIKSVLNEYYDCDEDRDDDSYEKTLLILELQNGERIIGITNISDPTIVELPVHIVEQQQMDENGYSIYYRLYSYQNMADEVSELVLYQQPFLSYAPKQNIIDSYFNYWISIVNLNDEKNKENKNDKEGFSNFIISTNSLS